MFNDEEIRKIDEMAHVLAQTWKIQCDRCDACPLRRDCHWWRYAKTFYLAGYGKLKND